MRSSWEDHSEAEPEAGHGAGSQRTRWVGAGVGGLEKGGLRAEGEGPLLFWSLAKSLEPTLKLEGAVPKTALPSDTMCKLGGVPQTTVGFSNSREGITGHADGCNPHCGLQREATQTNIRQGRKHMR